VIAAPGPRTHNGIVQIPRMEDYTMVFEKRKHVRRGIVQHVAILRADGTVVCECTLRDVSDTGARLKLITDGKQAPDIAQEFILSLSKRGNIFRQCETVWRRGDEIGVRFVPRNRQL
jgi:hypothetical protein